MPPTGKLIAQSLVGIRRNRTAEAAERIEQERAARDVRRRRRRHVRRHRPAAGSTASRCSTSRCSSASACSSPCSSESDLVRRGAYVRPPIDTWVGSWRALGFNGLTYKAANSRYRPGRRQGRLGDLGDAAADRPPAAR